MSLGASHPGVACALAGISRTPDKGVRMETPETPTPSPDDLPNDVDTSDLPNEPAEGEDSGTVVEEGGASS